MPDPFYLDSLRRITQAAPDMNLLDRQKLASLGRYAQSEGVDVGMYGDRNAEGYGLMLDDLSARQKPVAQPVADAPKTFMKQAFATQVETPAVMNPTQQAGHLQGMINQASNAWGNELDSRVAQNREMRRMQHEKDMERMRQEAVLKRLQMEQEMMREQMRQQRIAADRANGVISSTNWNKY